MKNKYFLSKSTIVHISWNLQGHNCIHVTLPVVPVLSQMNSVHASPSCFIKFHPIIILQTKRLSDKCALLFMFSDQNHVLVCCIVTPV